MTWEEQFRQRMSNFISTAPKGTQPLSIKIRPISDCFHRRHSPQAYRLIDDYICHANIPSNEYRLEEHETGPEILVLAALSTAGLSLAKSVVELITAIIKARSEGIKKGDTKTQPIELIVRGITRDGEYFEEEVLRLPPDAPVTKKLIEGALRKTTPKRKGGKQ